MKLLPDEIHFDCPQCKRPMSGDKALLGEMIHCPDCLEPFYVTLRKPEPAPESAKPEFGYECPKCRRIFYGKMPVPHESVSCPNCGVVFPPPPRPALASQDDSSAALVRMELTKGRGKIRSQAYKFTGFAVVFWVIGLLIGLASLVQAISGEEGAGRLFIVAASLIGTALWFYLIAQIIHIRANTEK
jgi:DNA-directed RNA polymerase subunit RPC12/RpoP